MGHLIERVFRSMWAVPSRMIFCTSCILMFLGILSMYSSLNQTKSTNDKRYRCGSVALHSLNLYFQVFVLVFLLFSGRHFFCWDGHINKWTSFLLVLYYQVWSVGLDSLSVWIGMSQSMVASLFSVTVEGVHSILLLLLQELMEELEPEDQFLQYARNGDLPGIQRLLTSKKNKEMHININCKGVWVKWSDRS